jgi:hypothetical protein
VVGGVFDAVLKQFLTNIVPEYVPSTLFVLIIFVTLWVSSCWHEACWAHKLSRNRTATLKWFVVSLAVAWAVTSVIESGPGFFMTLSAQLAK